VRILIKLDVGVISESKSGIFLDLDRLMGSRVREEGKWATVDGKDGGTVN
jgi:hypothetical protein